MIIGKFIKDIYDLKHNFENIFEILNIDNTLSLKFRNNKKYPIDYFKFYILGKTEPIILDNINLKKKKLNNPYGENSKRSLLRFVPFEYNGFKNTLSAFLFSFCEKKNCDSVVTHCRYREKKSISDIVCLEHCELNNNCFSQYNRCKKKENLVDLNKIIDNYLKYSLDKIFDSKLSEDKDLNFFKDFPKDFKENKFYEILNDFFKNKSKQLDYLFFYQKLRVCAILGSFKVIYEKNKEIIYGFENHPLNYCRTNTGKRKNFCYLINNIFQTGSNNQFYSIANNNKYRLYYKKQFFPQQYIKIGQHNKFFELVNYSEKLRGENPDMFYKDLASNIYQLLEREKIYISNCLSIADLGCGEGNLVYKLITTIKDEKKDIRFKIQLLEYDRDKLKLAEDRLKNEKDVLIDSIEGYPMDIFKLGRLNPSDLAIISQVFDLYIDFIPVSTNRTRSSIQNRELFSFYYSLVNFADNCENEGELYMSYEREIVQEFEIKIKKILNKIMSFSQHLVLFDHYFTKKRLKDLIPSNVKIKEIDRSFVMKSRGIYFLFLNK